MGKAAAAAGGFLLGSAVTIALTYFLLEKQKSKEKTQGDGEQRSRSLASSSSKKSSYAMSAGAGERSGFMTEILAQLWSYISVAGGQMVQETMEPMFKDMMPGPLSTLHFTKCDMGKVPIRLDNVVVHEIKDGAVQFDVDVVWDGDCEISLKTNYGLSFGVKSIKLNGRMSFLLAPLTNQLPVVSAIQYAFINPPDLELDFTGLAQIADFKGIDKSIRNIMQASLASMLVLPYRMLYKMDPANNFFETYQPPIGIARVTAVKGRGFAVEKKSLRQHDVPDVYLTIQLGEKVWRTSTVKDSLEPDWGELADFILSDHDQIISVHAWDEDRGKFDSDDDLGSAQISVGELLLSGKTKELELEQNGNGTGAFITLCCDICEWTTDLSSFETQKGENVLCGLLTILVTRAFGIPLAKEDASCFVKATCGTCEFSTSVVVDAPGCDALNPYYDCAFEVPLTAEMMKNGGDSVVFNLVNMEKHNIDKKDTLGTTTVTFESLVNAPNKTITEQRKIGDQGASLEFSVILRGIKESKHKTSPRSLTRKPPSIAASPEPSVPEQTPIEQHVGTVRLTVVKGVGFQVEKRRFKKDDIPDVYCKIKFESSPQEWKTSTIKNSTSPEWNQSFEFAVDHHGQEVRIDAFDEDRGAGDSDDFIGSAKATIGKLLMAGGTMDVELQSKGQGRGQFITLRCEMVDP